MYEVKNTLDWAHGRLDISEEKSSKFENTVIILSERKQIFLSKNYQGTVGQLQVA